MVLDSQYSDSLDEIKKRYLQLAKEYHPDNVFGKDSMLVERYNQKFRDIQEAYSIIKNSAILAS